MIILYITLLLLILINHNQILINMSLGLLVGVSVYQNSTDDFILFFAFASGLVTFLTCLVCNKKEKYEKGEFNANKVQQSLIIIVLVLISSLLSLAFTRIKINTTLINLSAENIKFPIEFILIVFTLFLVSHRKKRRVYE